MKNFRLLLICVGLLFLDIPSPSSACITDESTTLEINTVMADETPISFIQLNSSISSKTTSITESKVYNQVKQAVETGKYYSKEEKCYYDIIVTSYNIESIILVKNDRSEIEITLPYEFNEEDIIIYERGKKDFIKLVVKISAEYKIIIPEEQPE